MPSRSRRWGRGVGSSFRGPAERPEVRQWPALHDVFVELRGAQSLWVTMDRAALKVPLSADHPGHIDEGVMHWGVDARQATSIGYKCMLFLTDAARGEGCFERVTSIC